MIKMLIAGVATGVLCLQTLMAAAYYKVGNDATGAAALAAGAQASAGAKKTFVLWDPALQLPAMCYRLDADWTGKGLIVWNMRSDNKYMASTILSSPKKHLLVQTMGPMAMSSEVLTPQRLAEFQNPNVMAQGLAAEINKGIVEPGLSEFVAVGGRFTQEMPPITKLFAAAYRRGSTISTVSAFGFEGTFSCLYGGVRCEAKYVTSFALSVSAVPNPRIPKLCNYVRVAPVLVIAPPGKIGTALQEGGRMFASSFVNRAWADRRDSTLRALIGGTIQGRNEGWELWRKSQADTAALLERVRKWRSEGIRDVVTVDNPFEPGKKVERTAFFEKSWINSRQDMMLLSDNSLEPNTIRGLMEQGEWLPAN